MSRMITIDQVSKLYRIGTRQRARYRTVRDTVSDALAGTRRWLRRASPRPGPAAPAAPDTHWALKDVSFNVDQGEVVGIIGRNGAGKSTLLKILSRITEPTSGTLRLRGRVGSLLEVGTGFHPELTGRENIYLNGVILGMSQREVARKFDEIVAFAEIEEFLDTPVKRYSSGMYVRLAFAVAAHLEPEILVIDEILAVGDIGFQKKCLGKMGRIAQSGRTILFVSHNMAVVQNLCDRAVLLSAGRVALAGKCADVLAAYMGSDARLDQRENPLPSYRPPGMLPIIQDIVLTDEAGQPADRFFAGSGLTVTIHYDSPVPLNNPVFGIFARGITGERLFHLQSLAMHGPVAAIPRKGVVVCRVPALPLVPGKYSLSFNCSTVYTSGNLDSLDGAISLHVEAADYFGTGRLPPSVNGPFLIKGEWAFPGQGATKV